MEKKVYETTKFLSDFYDYSTYSYLKESDGMRLFLKGLKDKKILGVKCKSCGRVYVPPVIICGKCFKEIDLRNVVECKDSGPIKYFSLGLADIRGNPLEEPTIAIIMQFEGSDTLWIGRLEGVDPKAVDVGVKLKVKWKEPTTGQLSDIDNYEIVS